MWGFNNIYDDIEYKEHTYVYVVYRYKGSIAHAGHCLHPIHQGKELEKLKREYKSASQMKEYFHDFWVWVKENHPEVFWEGEAVIQEGKWVNYKDYTI